MKQLVWLVILAFCAGTAYLAWRAANKYKERKRAAEERFANFMAQTMKAKADAPAVPAAAAKPAPVAAPAPAAASPSPAPARAPDLAPQRLLFEAAEKAAEAGEPALAIQLYARLIARYPNGALVAQARAAVEAQKSRLARPQSSA